MQHSTLTYGIKTRGTRYRPAKSSRLVYADYCANANDQEIHVTTNIARVLLMVLAMFFNPNLIAHTKTDTVTLYNGDRITGEIKSLYGQPIDCRLPMVRRGDQESVPRKPSG